MHLRLERYSDRAVHLATFGDHGQVAADRTSWRPDAVGFSVPAREAELR